MSAIRSIIDLSELSSIDRGERVVFRFRNGVPATLATTCLLANTCDAQMTPYPCLAVQEEGKCGDLQNAVDLFLDSQDVLWVLDTGVVETLDCCPNRTGPPTVWAFDLCTCKVNAALLSPTKFHPPSAVD